MLQKLHQYVVEEIMNKSISELSRNGNDMVNMYFHIASLNAGKINPKKTKFRSLDSHVWNYGNTTSCIKLVRDLLNKPINKS